jgi:hypothetical protein
MPDDVAAVITEAVAEPDDPLAGPGPGARRDDPAAAAAPPWRFLVAEHSLVAPSDLINHPENPKRHPAAQAEAVASAIAELGFIGEIVVSRRSGRILDGHLRVAQALRDGQPLVPVGWADCESDEQELAILATYDPLGAMATADRDRLAALADRDLVAAGPLKQMLSGLAARPPSPRPGGTAGAPRGAHLGAVPDLVHPVVVECASEGDAEVLLDRLTDEGHAAYLLPPSPSGLAEG